MTQAHMIFDAGFTSCSVDLAWLLVESHQQVSQPYIYPKTSNKLVYDRD